MPINVNDPEYVKAEKEFYEADTPEDQLIFLNKMLSHAPKHKSAENFRKQLTIRRKKIQEQIIKKKKTGKGKKTGIKKEDNQVIIIGKTNSGKSSLLSLLTNAKPRISENQFTTTYPVIGMFTYETVPIQLIENPAIESEFYDKGLINSADTIIFLINSLDQLKTIKKEMKKSKAKKIIVFNKSDLLNNNEKRKIQATLQSKKYNFVLISSKEKENLEELKKKIFQSFNKIRVYTKEPGKEKSKKPIILKPNSVIKDVAEKILKGFSQKIKETKIWGPSSKFAGQKIGLNHKLKDLDVIEFRTK